MRVLLVNPAMNLKSFGGFRGLLEPMPVIGLAYIAAVLQQEGHEVKAIDQFTHGWSVQRLVDEVSRFRPDVLGVGMLTPSTPVSIEIAKQARRMMPQLSIVAGNVHADIFYKEILSDSEFDFVVHGEGEHTIGELVEAIGRGDTDFSAVQGISWKDRATGEIHKSAARPVIEDLDSLPYPAWNLFPYTRYGLLPFADVAYPVLSMAGSRGCPYRCEFCSLLYTGSNYRKRDPIKLVDEYEFLHDRYGIKMVGFVDPIFPLNKRVLFRFCEELMRRGLHKKVCWLSETRVDRIDRESLRIMRASGCRRLLLGIESGVDLLLENVNKTFSTETTRQAVRTIRQEGIDTVGLFMIGLPGETPEMTRQTIDFAKSLDLDFAKFAITVPFPGSQMFEDLRREGRLDRDDWENWTTFQPDPKKMVFVPREVSNEYLLKMQKQGTREFYLRPSMIYRHLVQIRTIRPGQLWHGLRGMFL
jgi:anaerobic magnesium-protoporphyrin IX monomethyl ester cyclase